MKLIVEKVFDLKLKKLIGLGFDLNYYYRIKKEAIINMAYALNIEVYAGDYDEND